jgi:hypothetical protein
MITVFTFKGLIRNYATWNLCCWVTKCRNYRHFKIIIILNLGFLFCIHLSDFFIFYSEFSLSVCWLWDFMDFIYVSPNLSLVVFTDIGLCWLVGFGRSVPNVPLRVIFCFLVFVLSLPYLWIFNGSASIVFVLWLPYFFIFNGSEWRHCLLNYR